MNSAKEAQTEKRNLKALIIEDTTAYASLLAKRLSNEANPTFEVESADRLETGLEFLNHKKPDIVLLDLNLPDSRGLGTFTKIHAQAPNVPVVILTMLDDKSLALEAVQKGAQDYLMKGHFNGRTLPLILSFAMQRHEIETNLRNLSLTDELTQLDNRRGFFTLAEQQLKLSRRNKRGLLLVFLDLDGLKDINDTLSHEVGDQALKDVAGVLKATFRESDIVARIGGDEFAVLAIEARADSGAIALTRLERKLRAHNEQMNRTFKLSLSSGVAYFDPANPCSLEHLIAQADRAMYQYKLSKKVSTNTLSVPETPVSMSGARERKTSSSDEGKKKILIIEDDPTLQECLGYRLRKLGFEVIAARDGKEGLEQAVAQSPNLIILDLMLPEFSGEDVCKAIREDEDDGFANIPIIMLTAKSGDVDRILGKVIGANAYMTKPYSAKDLVAEVNRLIRV